MACEPDETKVHMPAPCQGCPHYAECQGIACIAERRIAVDAIVSVNVTEHRALEITCPLSGQKLRRVFPENIRGPIQYGENLQSLVVSLNTVGALNIERIHEILGNVFNIPLSTGVISNIVRRCADRVTGIVSAIADKLKGTELTHFDESGTRVDGKTWWVHNASNAAFTYLDISRKRGLAGMDEIDILPEFEGIAVHDCWSPYWKYPGLEHAICNAHITRELIGILQNHPEQTWASDFKKLLEEMKRVRDKAAAKGENRRLSVYIQLCCTVHEQPGGTGHPKREDQK